MGVPNDDFDTRSGGINPTSESVLQIRIKTRLVGMRERGQRERVRRMTIRATNPIGLLVSINVAFRI